MTAAAEALSGLLGDASVSTIAVDLEEHARDWSAGPAIEMRSGTALPLPSCVVRPRSTANVSEILRWANDTGTPIVPFGAGSGVCNGIRPEGAVVVDLRAMDRVLDIDAKSMLVRAEAGIMGPALDARLRAEGLMLGHEPQSIAISTLGGWVATRACGQLSARYGGIEDLVIGLEAVLPGGKIVRSRPVARRSTGPDVAALMIGSEGSLGIVTEATLKVVSVPEEREDRVVRFERMADGIAACRALAQSDLTPTVVRLYDETDSTIFLRHHPDEPQGVLLLLSFDGDDARGRAERAVALTGGVLGNAHLVEHWWSHRNDAVEDFKELIAGRGLLGPHAVVDTMEVSGTWTGLRDLYHGIKDALTPDAALLGCHVSHIYPHGACLYFTLAAPAEDDVSAAALLGTWWEKGMDVCTEVGGAISHHHGVGRLKAAWLPAELDGWWDVLVAVKRAVDPKGIMNPGVLGL
ncbi:MAG TPA: FAD-binding oxidoreductase [Actinomycetota bacterium]|nr:FAD-binding oxidoreductase [Actinomycetota bacterium]